jgi:hypothetical protein
MMAHDFTKTRPQHVAVRLLTASELLERKNILCMLFNELIPAVKLISEDILASWSCLYCLKCFRISDLQFPPSGHSAQYRKILIQASTSAVTKTIQLSQQALPKFLTEWITERELCVHLNYFVYRSLPRYATSLEIYASTSFRLMQIYNNIYEKTTLLGRNFP